MKKLFFFIALLLLFSSVLFAQMGINTDNSLPDNSAMLDVKSNSKGMLVPRMPQSQISAITTPANGLQVFCTTDSKIYVYVSTVGQWKEVAYGTGTITPFSCGIPITDSRDGKTYNTVLIGTHCWMAQNLNIGTMILGSSGQTNHSAIEKYCYDDDESNCTVYGGLYQWNEMMQYVITQGAQGICPTGWHIPTDGEWTILTDFLGGESVAGGPMKEAGTAHWLLPNTGATNSSGFTALPGGYRLYNGDFYSLTGNAYFWSSTEYSSTDAWYRNLFCGGANVLRYNDYKTDGFSARCVKDATQSIPDNQILQNITTSNGQTTCYNATQTITVAGGATTFNVQYGGSVTMIAGESISYLPGTTVQSGGNMWGYIAPNGPYCLNPSLPSAAATEDKIPVNSEQSSFNVYPNPTSGNFTLELNGDFPSSSATIEILGIWGEKVLTKVLTGDRKCEFSLSDRPSGIYFIRVISGSNAASAKIIKQ